MNLTSVLETIVQVLSMAIGVGTGFFFYRILCFFASPRRGIFWSVLIVLCATFQVNMVIFSGDSFNVTFNLCWLLTMMFVAFKGEIFPRLAAVAVLFPLIISLNFLLRDILGQVYLMTEESFVVDLLTTLAEAVLSLLFWYFISRFFQKRLDKIAALFDHKTWVLLSIICIASLVSIISCIYFPPLESWKFWACAFACMITNIGCLYLAEYFLSSIQTRIERNQLKLQEDYYHQLEENQNQISKLRHDLNNHLCIMQELLTAGDPGAAEAYFRQIQKQVSVRNRVFCKNSILNAVINAKYNLAEELGIDCFFHIDLNNLTSIDDISLCSLFANTLDNAIEACKKIPEKENRTLSLKARTTDNGYFSYQISNAKINPIKKKGGRFLSDKVAEIDLDQRHSLGQLHGLGIENIRQTVEKYGGTLDISYTDDSFTVTVLICQ